MNKHVKSAHSGLFAVRLAVSLALAAPAAVFGQSASLLEEVTVTATRQTETANRIPMSIAAVTQESLDQIGIKSASDLTQIVPALTLVNQTAGVGTFAIRGIVATTGAATTGVYLDDTALTKRNNPGVSQNNGAPLPLLFDLQRVEVLKGPQGTLYGGSSQGGTIRFITPHAQPDRLFRNDARGNLRPAEWRALHGVRWSLWRAADRWQPGHARQCYRAQHRRLDRHAQCL
jgi:outer membrane receptor protein involved in Fe transport